MVEIGNALLASVESLPMAEGLYLFFVRSDGADVMDDCRHWDPPKIVLPAYKVEPGPGTSPDAVEVICGPGTDGVWLHGQRDQMILNVKVPSANVLLTSLSVRGATPLDVKIQRIDAPIFPQPIAQPEHQPQSTQTRPALSQPDFDATFDDCLAIAPHRLFNGPDTPLDHLIWRAARDRILDAAAGGPNTLALLGPPGTGKTWLLHALGQTLRQRGHSVTLVRQGETPFELGPGAVVLVDEAARMGQERLMSLSSQSCGLLVLADVPEFSDRLNALPHPPGLIRLAPLSANEVRGFVTQWLERSVGPRVTVEESAIARLIVHAACVPRLVTQTLRRALTIADASGQTSIDGADIDAVACSRPSAVSAPITLTAATFASLPPSPVTVGASEPGSSYPPQPPAGDRSETSPDLTVAGAFPLPVAAEIRRLEDNDPAQRESHKAVVFAAAPTPGVALPKVAVEAPPPRLPGRSRHTGFALAAGAALAASIGIVVVFSGMTTRRLDGIPVVRSASTPELKHAGVSRSDPTGQSTGIEISGSNANVASAPLAPSGIQPATQVAMTFPKLAASPLPDPPAMALKPEKAIPTLPDVPGLMLVAQPGDTMQTLYSRIYRGLRPPPFAEVAAVNPRIIRAGVVVAFPAPPGGWVR